MTKTIKKMRDWIERQTNVRIVLIVILLFLCAYELETIVGDFRSTYTSGQTYISYNHGQVTRMPDITTPSDIQSWMTFGYVDFVFRLPPGYLEADLHLSDPHYPNVQIRRYALKNKMDVNQLTESVQKAVAAYGH